MNCFLKLAKGLSLLTPFVLCLVLFVAVLLPSMNTSSPGPRQKYTQSAEPAQSQREADLQREADQLENKVSVLLSIVGIAVTVWVSLNIYNVIERKQVDLLVDRAKDLEDRIRQLTEREQALSKDMETLKGELDENVNKLLQNQEMLESTIASGIPASFG